jgi:cell division septation protein DedD
MDPLEELARIMNDTNTPDPNKRPDDQAKSSDEPLDLGLGDQGLAELFGDQRFDEDPVLSTSFEAELESAANEPTDALFKDLDFSEVELPGLNDPAPTPTEPAVAAPTAGDAEPIPSLTEHLTPRPPEPAAVEPVQRGAVQEDDLLAAMDALALDEPATASAAPPPPPLPFEQPGTQPPAFAARSADPAANSQAGEASEMAFDDGVDHQPAFEDFDHADREEGRAGPGRMVLFALGAVALLGVGGVIAFGLISSNDAQDSAPQVIAAADGDDKVEPVATEDTQSQPGDAVFSRLDQGDAPATSAPRVILPQPDNDGLPLQSGQRLPSADIAPAAPGSTASRAVRTVTVRADGTVVESTAPAVTAPAPEAPTDVQVEAANARPVEVVSVSPAGVSVNTQPIADAVSAAQSAAQTVTETTADTVQNAAQAALDQATQAVTTTAPPVPVARPASVQTQPVQVAPAQPQPQSATPIQLATPAAAPTQPVTPQPATPQPVAQQPAVTQPTPTPAALPSSVPAGDFVVQLASLRSDEEARATFGRLQNRFGSILSGFGPNIQRADLGDRGIYHRVRVGPMDRAAADSLCQRYQSAGGDCFVQRQ